MLRKAVDGAIRSRIRRFAVEQQVPGSEPTIQEGDTDKLLADALSWLEQRQPLNITRWDGCSLSVLSLLPEIVQLDARVNDYSAWVSQAMAPIYRRGLRRELARAGIDLDLLTDWLMDFGVDLGARVAVAFHAAMRDYVPDGVDFNALALGR